MSWQTLKQKVVKIRIARICFGCYRKFEAGSEMNYCAAVDGGNFSSTYTCHTCNSVAIIDRENYDEGYEEGFVKESLQNGEAPEQYLQRRQEEEKKRLENGKQLKHILP